MQTYYYVGYGFRIESLDDEQENYLSKLEKKVNEPLLKKYNSEKFNKIVFGYDSFFNDSWDTTNYFFGLTFKSYISTGENTVVPLNFIADKNIIDTFNKYYENLTEENKQFISKLSTYEKPEFYICFTDC